LPYTIEFQKAKSYIIVLITFFNFSYFFINQVMSLYCEPFRYLTSVSMQVSKNSLLSWMETLYFFDDIWILF
jgi:hypothetical protein